MTKDIERERKAFEDRFQHLDLDFVDELGYCKSETQTAWASWCAAKAHEAKKLEGCVVVPNDQIETWWQDAEEPENFETEAQNIHSIADGIDDGEIIEFHEHHTIHLPSSTLFGVWTYKEGKRVFITGTKAEVIEAARGGNE
jgi:hypothetical protein